MEKLQKIYESIDSCTHNHKMHMLYVLAIFTCLKTHIYISSYEAIFHKKNSKTLHLKIYHKFSRNSPKISWSASVQNKHMSNSSQDIKYSATVLNGVCTAAYVTVTPTMTVSLILETSLRFDVIKNLLQIVILKPTLQAAHINRQHKRN